jgi:Flp pilus assembly pilin Flp
MVEYLLVFAFVALAVAGALALFGDELRAALGTVPTRPAPP